MKPYRPFTHWLPVLLLLVILASCKHSNDVVSNGLIQKRKYRNGYHLNLGKKVTKPESTIEDPGRKEQVEEDIASIDKAQQQLPKILKGEPTDEEENRYKVKAKIPKEGFSKH